MLWPAVNLGSVAEGSIDLTPIAVVFCLGVAFFGGVIGWAAWTGGAERRDDSETRLGRWSGLLMLWFGRLTAAIAVVSLACAGLLIVGSVGSGSQGYAAADSPPAIFPKLSKGVRRVGGLNGPKEAAANRQLRSQLPEMPGAQLVRVTDHYLTNEDSDDRAFASGVQTDWTYRISGVTKCQIADTLEHPLATAGWTQRTLETSGIPPEAGNARLTEFYRSGSSIVISLGAPPTSFEVRIVSHRRESDGSPSPAAAADLQMSLCHPDVPPAPPDKPVNRAAALKANQAIYSRLPIPAGAVVTAHSDDAATAMGNGNVPIGYGSGWDIQLPPGTHLCASAAAFDAAMAKAGWERFTTQSPAGRESRYFQPPRSVEVTWTGTGSLYVLVMNNGAVVGTRQHPDPKAFSAGATPETRGAPVPCKSP